MSNFKSDYATMKSSMCRLQKCKKNEFRKISTFGHVFLSAVTLIFLLRLLMVMSLIDIPHNI